MWTHDHSERPSSRPATLPELPKDGLRSRGRPVDTVVAVVYLSPLFENLVIASASNGRQETLVLWGHPLVRNGRFLTQEKVWIWPRPHRSVERRGSGRLGSDRVLRERRILRGVEATGGCRRGRWRAAAGPDSSRRIVFSRFRVGPLVLRVASLPGWLIHGFFKSIVRNSSTVLASRR
jgi:hypothetical protein